MHQIVCRLRFALNPTGSLQCSIDLPVGSGAGPRGRGGKRRERRRNGREGREEEKESEVVMMGTVQFSKRSDDFARWVSVLDLRYRLTFRAHHVAPKTLVLYALVLPVHLPLKSLGVSVSAPSTYFLFPRACKLDRRLRPQPLKSLYYTICTASFGDKKHSGLSHIFRWEP